MIVVIISFKPVPAGSRDVVWLPEQTQSQSGPKISEQQEQLWGLARVRGTLVQAMISINFTYIVFIKVN